MTGRRRSAALSVLFGYASLAVSLARNVLFVPIYLHSISLAEYGAWLATGGALALMIINDFGLSGVVMQKISSSFGGGEHRALGSLAGSGLAIGTLMALLLTAISLGCAPYLPGLQSLSASQKHTVIACFLIAVGANGLGLIGVTVMSVIRSLQMAVTAGSIVLAADLANIAVTLIGLLRGHGLYSIPAGMVARSGVTVIAGAIGLVVIFSGLRIVPLLRWRAVRELIGDASRFFLTSVAMRMQSQANVVFVSSILGPGSAAIYALTIRAHETVMLLISQINASMVPSVTHLFGSGNARRFRAVLLRLLLAVAAITALALSATVILNGGFLHLWLQGQHFSGQKLSILTAIALFTASLGSVAYDALVSQGHFNFVSRTFFLASLLQLALLAAFMRLGLWVAPVVSLICASLWVCAFWTRMASCIRLGAREMRELAVELLRIGTVSGLAVAVLLTFLPTANSWRMLVAEGVLTTAVLVCGYLLTSGTLRTIAREELGMTLRALRAA